MYTRRVAALAVVLIIGLGVSVFGSQPKVRSIIFCKGVNSHTYRPIDKTNVFSVTDPAVYCFVDIATPRDVSVRVEWYAPDGSLYHTTDIGLLHGPSRPDGASGWYVYGALGIEGAPAATMPGTWRVEVVLHPGPNKTGTFQIVGAPSGKEEPGEGVTIPPRTPPGESELPLLSDDFSDPTSGWETHSDSAGGYGYEGGAYFLEVNRPNQTRWSLAGKQLADFVIDVDTTLEHAAGDASWGLICRYRSAEDFYLFEISNDGYYAISALNRGKWSSLVGWTKAEVIRTGAGAGNHLRVACRNDLLSLWVNGVLLAEVRDQAFAKGDIGFSLTTYAQGGARVLFDDLVARSVENK